VEFAGPIHSDPRCALLFYHGNSTQQKAKGETMSPRLLQPNRSLVAGMLTTFLSLATCGLTGCERKEKVVDIETPGADVEVHRDIDTGEVEVETNRE
jgi:hypothetical protein